MIFVAAVLVDTHRYLSLLCLSLLGVIRRGGLRRHSVPFFVSVLRDTPCYSSSLIGDSLRFVGVTHVGLSLLVACFGFNSIVLRGALYRMGEGAVLSLCAVPGLNFICLVSFLNFWVFLSGAGGQGVTLCAAPNYKYNIRF